MFRSGAIVSTDNELVQSCIKGMTSLFQSHTKHYIAATASAIANSNAGANKDEKQSKFPFPLESIRSLVELLTSSISEITASHQNAAFQLIRSIVDAKVLIPEVYDLMSKLVDQTVLSHRKGVRDSASSTVVAFIITYPLGEKRLTAHIKQFIKNCSYDYEEG